MSDTTDLITRYKLSVDKYCRMGQAGIFRENEPVELIDGQLIVMPPISSDHAGTINRLTQTLVLACGQRAVVSVQNPVRLGRYSEPQPDIAILRPRPDFYTGRHAEPADVLVLIEVADSSLAYDRRIKLPLYARAGIPEFWIIDLARRTLDAHSAPTGDAYATTRTYAPGDVITLTLAPRIELNVADILGPGAAP